MTRRILCGIEEGFINTSSGKMNRNIAQILDILKQTCILSADVKNWLFYPHFTDPIGGLQYLLDLGLSPAQVVDFIVSEPDYLL